MECWTVYVQLGLKATQIDEFEQPNVTNCGSMSIPASVVDESLKSLSVATCRTFGQQKGLTAAMCTPRSACFPQKAPQNGGRLSVFR
mmetsp:Transcript_77736/g.130481  ORF Transcript_77736/g.130481 Transcript_77736/m.130481 type:complete len:87 (+) Transcript_77736:470-730(+)